MLKKSYLKVSSKIYTLIFLLVLTISFTLLCLNIQKVKFEKALDEGYYLTYATYIGQKGISGFIDLFKDYIQNQRNWLFPNPLRIGFIIISAIWLKIFGYTFLELAYISLFFYCAFLVISFYFSKRYLDEKIALLFTTLLTFSPINMAMAKRALIDSTANAFCVLSLWLFLSLLKKRSSLKYTIFIVAYSFTILIKESSVLLSFLFVIFLLLYRFFFKKPVYLRDFLAVTFFPFLTVGLVYIGLGGIHYTWETIKIILKSPQINQYAILFGSGPWFRYLIDYLLLSPWTLILCVAFIFCYFTSREHNETVLYFISVFIINFILFNFFTKNVRYVIILDIPIRLLSVLMLNKLSERYFTGYKRNLFIFSLVVLICVYDYINFCQLFLKINIYDPNAYLLLKYKHIIP